MLNRLLVFLVAVLVASAALALRPAAAAEAVFVGMQIQGNSESIAAALGLDSVRGVLVRDVALGGPADKAGFRRGDLILRFAGTDIETFETLIAKVGETKVGQDVEATVWRRGVETRLNLSIGSRPEAWRLTKAAFAKVPEIGLTVAALTPEMHKRFGLRWGSTGVVVTAIDLDKIAGTDIRQGELIRQINQEEVWRPEQLAAAVREAKKAGRAGLLLLVEGVSGFRFSLLTLE